MHVNCDFTVFIFFVYIYTFFMLLLSVLFYMLKSERFSLMLCTNCDSIYWCCYLEICFILHVEIRKIVPNALYTVILYFVILVVIKCFILHIKIMKIVPNAMYTVIWFIDVVIKCFILHIKIRKIVPNAMYTVIWFIDVVIKKSVLFLHVFKEKRLCIVIARLSSSV